MAFGTGAHTTTRHCLEAIERLVTAGDRVVDLGCGSGILAIAAARLGAEQVVALDVDSQAIQLATDNINRNGVSSQVRLIQGSLSEVPSPAEFDLIVANIRPAVLEEFLQQGLSNLMAPDARLVMSGILEEHLAAIVARAEQDQLAVERVMATDDWRTVILQKA